MYKYISFDEQGNFEYHKTEKEASDWCEEVIECCRNDDEFSEELMNGGVGYAKIMAQSVFHETDSEKNHPCLKIPGRVARCSNCDQVICEGTDEWAYDSDVIGDVCVEDVEE